MVELPPAATLEGEEVRLVISGGLLVVGVGVDIAATAI